jgi:hypothetical protein
MADYVTLMGAEDVRAAGSRMASAAEQMSRAASNMDDALQRHQRFLDDWLMRFETAVSALAASAGEK